MLSAGGMVCTTFDDLELMKSRGFDRILRDGFTELGRSKEKGSVLNQEDIFCIY